MYPQDIKILLVEDAAVMRKIEIKTLKNLGFEKIIEAVDGNEAIEKLQSMKDIDLVISDWNMPNKDGLELLMWIRKSEQFGKIPFLMATGQGEKKQEKKAIDAGVSSFVAKPFDGDELKSKIDEAFGFDQDGEQEEIATGPEIGASGKVKLRFAHIQITDHLILGVLQYMIERGMVKPEHFELDIQCMPGWNPVAQSLEKGTVDAACVLAPIAMDLFSVGVPIKLILLAHKSGSIFVRSRYGVYTDPYKEFFRDRTFYIPHKMSIHHMLAHMFFDRIGLTSSMLGEKPHDVTFEVVAPIKMPDFLRSNRDACGFMVAEPLGTKAIASGIAELQFLSGELWEQHPCCVVAMRDDFIEPHADAVYEITELLVQAGDFIEKKPELAAEIAVDFLDPSKKLGLKVPILKNVLLEQQGIKTGDLYPIIEDLDTIQQYMFHDMGIGTLIDLEKFVDDRFAKAAYKGKEITRKPSNIHDTVYLAMDILHRGVEEENKTTKAMLNKEGKYLTFSLGDQEYGIDILKVKEIIGMMPIRSIPQAQHFVKGVINLRDEVIPVIDLRAKFSMEEIAYTDRTCIIVLEFDVNGRPVHMGIAVDTVSEVLGIRASDIEDTPVFGSNINTNHILAMAKIEGNVKILLDIEEVLGCKVIREIDEVL